MRVALDGSFLSLPPSGTGTYMRELAAALRALDAGLDLAVLAPESGSPRSARQRFGFLDPESLVIRFRTRGVGVGGRAHAVRPYGRRADPDPTDDLRRLRRFAWDLVGVSGAVRRTRPDLLHVPHFSVPFGLPRDVPLVVTVHDTIPLVIPAYRASQAARLRLAIALRGIGRARLVLTPSAAAADDIERLLGVPRERIRVTPEAAGQAFVPAPDPDAPAAVAAARRFGVRGRYVFNVGGLDVRKNVPTLLVAFARALPRLHEPVQLVIGGAAHSANPTVFPPLAPVVARLGLENVVVFTGFLTEAEKIALYQGADLYVTPSLYEGFGLSALEAMACGAPVIAANRTSLPEVVGDAGVLVEPEPEPVAAAMVDLLNDPVRRAELRERGLARAAAFSWERTARLTLAAYEEAVGLGPTERSSGSRLRRS